MKGMEYLFTITGASARTGIPRSTIRSAIDRGEIKVSDTKTGDGLRLIDVRRLDVWYSKHEGTERRGKYDRK